MKKTDVKKNTNQPPKKETVTEQQPPRPSSKNATIEDAPAPRAEQAP